MSKKEQKAAQQQQVQGATYAYWLDGTPYCAACVECEDAPCLGEEEIDAASSGPASSGRCACCGDLFGE